MAGGPPEKVEQKQRALALVEEGYSIRAAARATELADVTVRRALSDLGRHALDAEQRGDIRLEHVSVGLQVKREALLARIADRVARDVDVAKPGELRDLAVALGILDDKVAGRGMGSQVNVTNATQIIVKSEWPEP